MKTTIRPRGIWARTVGLGLAGAAGFWLTNFGISLTPIAAEYRAALGIAYLPMLVEALLGGLIIGFSVSICLLRFSDRLPTTSPLVNAVLLSLIALIVATVLIEVPAKLLTSTDADLRYFLIGTAFNTFRFLALGVVIGSLHGRPRATMQPGRMTDAERTPQHTPF